ncbi:MAG: type II secretion system F family protein [Actinomycetota bacterium]|nr:type II secretion system F family protein [Actinomycetota bacterium]
MSAAVTILTVNAVVGGLAGLGVSVVAGGAVATLLRHTSAASDVRRRARIVADLPLTVDLLVACVSAGRAPSQALAVVCASVAGPIAEDLRPVCARLELGADARTVWSDLAAHDTLAPLGRALSRSARTGSSITGTLSRCAEDLRRDRRAVADADARKVGVRASAPLGACFLPAFFLIGVVPTIVGAIGSMHW